MNNQIFSGGKKWAAQEQELLGQKICQSCEREVAVTRIFTDDKNFSGEYESIPACQNCFQAWKQEEGIEEENES